MLVGLAQLRRRLECVETRVREDADPADLFHRRAVDLLDLAHHELEATVVRSSDRELVDGDSSPRSTTSMPTMSPPTAPMREATRPSAPGRSGSHTRTRTWMALLGGRRSR